MTITGSFRHRRICAAVAVVAGAFMVCGQDVPVLRPLPPVVRAINAAAAEVAAASASVTNPPTARTNLDLLEFISGDTLRGRFLGWEAGKGIRWQHDGVQGELLVIPDKIRRFRLQRSPQRATKPLSARLFFHNGDHLSAEVLSVDEQNITFDSWYIGKLQVPRAAISNIVLYTVHGDLLYHGPTGLEGWQQSSPLRMDAAHAARNFVVVDGEVMVAGGVARPAAAADPAQQSWIFDGEALEAVRPGAVGRDFKLPRLSMVSMELEAPNMPAFTLHLYADATDRFTAFNALSLTFSGRMIYVRRSLANGGMRQIGNVDHQKFASGTPSRIKLTLCTDLDQQVMAVFLDDIIIRKLSIAGQVDGLGTGLVIQQQAAASLKISNLTISRWNGMVEDSVSTPTASKEDLLLLNNRDKISGRLIAIRDGKADFHTAFSKVEIPLERIQRISFGLPPKPLPKTDRQARLLLGDTGRLTLQIQRWDEKVIEGVCPGVGSIQVNARAVVGVHFE